MKQGNMQDTRRRSRQSALGGVLVFSVFFFCQFGHAASVDGGGPIAASDTSARDVSVGVEENPAMTNSDEGQKSRELADVARRKLKSDPLIDDTAVLIKADGKHVALSGQVDSYANKLRAERIIQGIRGVDSINNKLTVKLGESVSYENLKAAVRSELQDFSGTEGVDIMVDGGMVTLRGDVDSFQKAWQQWKSQGCIGILSMSSGSSSFPFSIFYQDIQQRDESLFMNLPILTLLAFLGCQFLLAMTVAAAHMDLSALSLPIALLLASAKTALITFVFMDLRLAAPIIRYAAAAGVVLLILALLLTGGDYLFRGPGFTAETYRSPW